MRVRIVSLILFFSAFVNAQHELRTQEAWFDAAARDNLSAVKKISKKVNVDVVNSNGESALLLAANSGAQRVVAFLLSQKAQVNIKDKSGNTPIFYAVSSGYGDIVELLIRHGADLKFKYQAQENILFEAVRFGHVQIAFSLIKRAPQLLHQANARGETAVFSAVRGGHYLLAEKMIQSGAQVNIRNKNGQSLFAVAKASGLKSVHPLFNQLQANP